ncbi:CoA-dependent acyltransferase [Aspergillus steynii IBT 23096]|uniref:CoA-dependent acyltransferase n=1 Tax=Aspergillus steynii IBT 23096 TaxID=1392250 RepID=A0A2I2GGU3_9EURO|nr:CoA-dependent acyltransferase [Aspergillus steynii IBT 23096]PLB52099.1 CoA-dependent acyltransferase [Aspergillus steynii IBT 23096]
MDTWISLYEAIVTDRDTATVPCPRYSYADFTLWHNEQLKSSETLANRSYWSSHLDGLKEAHKPPSFFKGNQSTALNQRGIHRLRLPANLHRRLGRICSMLGATSLNFLAASFRTFMYHNTGDRDVPLFMVDETRPHETVEGAIGYFTNLLPLRVQIRCDDMSFEELVMREKENFSQARSHVLPFNEIVDCQRVKSTTKQLPLGEIAIQYRNQRGATSYRTADLEATIDETIRFPSHFDICLEAEEKDGDLELSLDHSASRYNTEDMERFFGDFLLFLSSLIRDPRQAIEEAYVNGTI